MDATEAAGLTAVRQWPAPTPVNSTIGAIADLKRAMPRNAVAGERYEAPLMKMLDSERPASSTG